MTDDTVSALRSSGTSGTAPLQRDPVYSGLPSGAARHVFDPDVSWCDPRGGLSGRPVQKDPTQAMTIYDIAKRSHCSADPTTVFGQPFPTYAAGSWGFSACAHLPHAVQAPSDRWTTIHSEDPRVL